MIQIFLVQDAVDEDNMSNDAQESSPSNFFLSPHVSNNGGGIRCQLLKQQF